MADDRPNILLICADQLAQQTVGAYGDKWVQTPHVDGLALRGVKFEQVYTPCPLCQPARASFWSGLYPHQTGVLSNGARHPVPQFPQDKPTLGTLFRDAGYETVHFGKTHDAGTLNGFNVAAYKTAPTEPVLPWPLNNDTYHDVWATQQCVDYLENRKHDRPFLMVADLQNPHNICGYIGEHAGAHRNSPIPRDMPPLPENFEIEDLHKRPKPIQYLCCSHRRLSQAAQWTEENYRHYIAAYYHYTERMDTDLGTILEALERAGLTENTLVVFFSDHGDGVARHRMVTKQVSFYEETTRVPLIFAGPGVSGAGLAIGGPLVSLLDLVPTLCDCAGIDVPEQMVGRSVWPWVKGESPVDERQFVVSEWHTEWGYTIEPGRMIRTQGYKYTRYLEDDGEELFDLQEDPGETRTLIDDPDYAEVLDEHRKLLNEHVAMTGDPFFDMEIVVDPRFRSHALGYRHHEGGSAREVLEPEWAAQEQG